MLPTIAPTTGQFSRVNLTLILSAARLAAWIAKNPLWLAVQRLTMGFVLTGLAVRLALEERRN